MPEGSAWDKSLYAGSAPYYARGRAPYAPGLADAPAEALALDALASCWMLAAARAW